GPHTGPATASRQETVVVLLGLEELADDVDRRGVALVEYALPPILACLVGAALEQGEVSQRQADVVRGARDVFRRLGKAAQDHAASCTVGELAAPPRQLGSRAVAVQDVLVQAAHE